MGKTNVSRTIVAALLRVALIAILFAGLLALTASRARADVGLPPVNPSGSSLSPEGATQTNVRMVSEVVDLTVEPYERPVPEDVTDNPGYWMRVLVDAQFEMRNLGDTPEAFDVWFPLAAATRYPDLLLYETTRHPENLIQDFRVRVDGQPVDTRRVAGPALNYPEGESPWATFPVEFPPGQDVTIRVRYTLYPGGRRPFADIEYILQTGAGWRDTIGEATITVHLPDLVTPESVSQGGTTIFDFRLEPQPAGYVVQDDTVSWHFKGLEPGPEDNIFLNVLEPQRYSRLLEARRKVARASQDDAADAADASLELARAAREAVLIIKSVEGNGGGEALGEEASAAYERALELNPDVPSIYSEYARWLMIATRGWRELEFEGTCPEQVCALVQRGLEKFPQDAALLELDQMFQDSMRMHQTDVAFATQDAATATQQRRVTQAAVPSNTPHPTHTSTAVATAIAMQQAQGAPPTETPHPTKTLLTASPTAQPAGGGGICSTGLLPLALAGLLAGMFLYRRRRR